jgi:hypothetical protein
MALSSLGDIQPENGGLVGRRFLTRAPLSRACTEALDAVMVRG